MTFEEILVQARELLQQKGRVSYRALKLQFTLSDEYLDALRDELVDAERVAIDEKGKVLVWTGTLGEQGAKSTEHGAKHEARLESQQVEDLRSKVQSQEIQSLTPSIQPLAAERRQLTVMFCDLVGSTALSAQLDPEELREVVRSYQDSCTAVVRRYEGHVAQHLGDGLLVYFGYPVAHEDDAVRAVRAGLAIVSALQSLPSRRQVPSPSKGEGQGEGSVEEQSNAPHPYLLPSGEKELRRLRVRLGIHTGLVVIGEIGSSEKREMLALGETPNIAARIQGQANPDEVMISAATYRLVEGLFVTEDRGQPELKGVVTPLTLYRVTKESDAQSRFEVGCDCIQMSSFTPQSARFRSRNRPNACVTLLACMRASMSNPPPPREWRSSFPGYVVVWGADSTVFGPLRATSR